MVSFKQAGLPLKRWRALIVTAGRCRGDSGISPGVGAFVCMALGLAVLLLPASARAAPELDQQQSLMDTNTTFGIGGSSPPRRSRPRSRCEASSRSNASA